MVKSNMGTPNQSLYDVLGLSPTAAQEEIEKACIRLGELHRPDKNPSLEARLKFTQIERAYEILGDPENRRAYDLELGYQQPVESSSDIPLSEINDQIKKSKIDLTKILEKTIAEIRRPSFVYFFITVVLIFGLIDVFNTPTKSPRKTEQGLWAQLNRQTSEAEGRLLREIKAELKDPTSAIFENTKLYIGYLVIDGKQYPSTYTLCGMVNAKNSFGAYVGQRGFIATGVFDSKGEFTATTRILDGRHQGHIQEIKDNCQNTTRQLSDPPGSSGALSGKIP